MSRLLEHAVHDELVAYSALLGLDLDPERMKNLAWAVTTRLQYAFDISWAPTWVPKGSPHVWEESEATYARCTTCLAVSPPSRDRAGAAAWSEQHVRDSHLGEESRQATGRGHS